MLKFQFRYLEHSRAVFESRPGGTVYLRVFLAELPHFSLVVPGLHTVVRSV